MSAREAKNAQTAATFAATKAKRKTQACHVRTLKIQSNKLNRAQAEALKMAFIEGKWLTNAVLAWSETEGNTIDSYDTKRKDVIHKDKDGNEIVSEFRFLGSQVRQSVVTALQANVRALAARKAKGYKVGKLKFRRECRQLELKQCGVTYKIEGKRLRVQGIPGWLHVNGTKQLRDMELANAKLLNTPRGYYLAVTCYRNKEEEPKPIKDEVGIDLGCETAVTLSDGRKFKAKIRESDRLKRLQKSMARQQKRSKGWWRTVRLQRVEYRKMTCRRDDAANKIVHEIKQYQHVYMQDEMLRAWHAGRYSRSVQVSVLGRVKAKLKPYATVVLPATAPTTKMCIACGCLNDMPVNVRVYTCTCGVEPEDRDVHSAKLMLVLGKSLPVERREVKRGETRTAAAPSGAASPGRGTAKPRGL